MSLFLIARRIVKKINRSQRFIKNNVKKFIFYKLRQLYTVIRYRIKKTTRTKSNVVVYTAISGKYDILRSHQYLVDSWDYVCFTDEQISGLHAWEIRPMKELGTLGANRKAKYYKLFPHKLFPEYEYSIWIDGNWDITGPHLEHVTKRLLKKKNLSIALNPHNWRDCIFDEAKECIIRRLDKKKVIQKQMSYLRQKGFPKKQGLFEMNLILRKHHSPSVITLMESWWDMIMRFSKRDQLSFTYVLWRYFHRPDLLFEPGDNIRKNSHFVCHKHNVG